MRVGDGARDRPHRGGHRAGTGARTAWETRRPPTMQGDRRDHQIRERARRRRRASSPSTSLPAAARLRSACSSCSPPSGACHDEGDAAGEAAVRASSSSGSRSRATAARVRSRVARLPLCIRRRLVLPVARADDRRGAARPEEPRDRRGDRVVLPRHVVARADALPRHADPAPDRDRATDPAGRPRADHARARRREPRALHRRRAGWLRAGATRAVGWPVAGQARPPLERRARLSRRTSSSSTSPARAARSRSASRRRSSASTPPRSSTS